MIRTPDLLHPRARLSADHQQIYELLDYAFLGPRRGGGL